MVLCLHSITKLFVNCAEETGWIGLKRNSPEPVVTRTVTFGSGI